MYGVMVSKRRRELEAGVSVGRELEAALSAARELEVSVESASKTDTVALGAWQKTGKFIFMYKQLNAVSLLIRLR